MENTETDFWEQIEGKLSTCIPTYIRNLMKIQGYDNIVSLKRMSKEDIDFLDDYGKSEKYEKRIPRDAEKADYYGSSQDKNDFEIPRGHRKLFDEMIEIAQKIAFLSSKKGFFIHSLILLIFFFYNFSLFLYISGPVVSLTSTAQSNVGTEQNIVYKKVVDWVKTSMHKSKNPKLEAQVIICR